LRFARGWDDAVSLEHQTADAAESAVANRDEIRVAALAQRSYERSQVLLGVRKQWRLAVCTLHLRERRTNSEHAARIEERPHPSVEEHQQKGAAMDAIGARVDKDQDALIANARKLEGIAEVAADRRDEFTVQWVATEFGGARTSSIQRLAPHR
jgi:hypothetical protein